MPFDRPTLSDLIARVRADLRGRLEIQGALVRRAMADVLATVWAGAIHMLHGQLEYLSQQLFADTSEREFLLRQASLYGIMPTAATFSSGTVTATGTDASVIPVDTVLVRDDGFTYTVTAEATIAGGTADVAVQAVEAGTVGNMDSGDALQFESPVTGVDSSATVAAPGISGGNDEEATAAVRARFTLRLQEPPQGGADQDYEAWALEAAAGVTRAWVFRHENGLGTVVVRFVRDGDDSIFPDGAAVAEVQSYIDTQRPVTAEVTVAGPTQLDVDFTISITPDTTATRAAVEAELADLLLRVGEPGDGAGRGTVPLSQLQVAIGVADGVQDFTLTSPSADVVPALGELTVLGTVTWSS